jgi:hypothetical protein
MKRLMRRLTVGLTRRLSTSDARTRRRPTWRAHVEEAGGAR